MEVMTDETGRYHNFALFVPLTGERKAQIEGRGAAAQPFAISAGQRLSIRNVRQQ